LHPETHSVAWRAKREREAKNDPEQLAAEIAERLMAAMPHLGTSSSDADRWRDEIRRVALDVIAGTGGDAS